MTVKVSVDTRGTKHRVLLVTENPSDQTGKTAEVIEADILREIYIHSGLRVTNIEEIE